MNAIIVDDEPLAQDVLETFVGQVPQVTLVGKASNAVEANTLLQEREVDLMFLDVQMPLLNGIDFLKSLDRPPLVILTTAYSEFAVDAFNLNVVDYLMKPIALDRFMRAVNKAAALHGGGAEAGASVAEAEEDYMFVKADKKLVKVEFKDIVYVDGLKDYVIIRNDQGRVITLQTMKSLEAKLPASLFRRVHRSYIVNMEKVEAVEGNSLEVTQDGKTKLIAIGKNYREGVLEQVNRKKL